MLRFFRKEEVRKVETYADVRLRKEECQERATRRGYEWLSVPHHSATFVVGTHERDEKVDKWDEPEGKRGS